VGQFTNATASCSQCAAAGLSGDGPVAQLERIGQLEQQQQRHRIEFLGALVARYALRIDALLAAGVPRENIV
jgi:hypothetical protein